MWGSLNRWNSCTEAVIQDEGLSGLRIAAMMRTSAGMAIGLPTGKNPRA